ncbi:MAG: hypothetical protein K0R64_2935 [Novosphingobium lindaniclasticum]|jgi:hypothetical protein|uniref:DUF4336 domain-containing protein n=1 Tax=Novosphingobium lindaniclasticum TaxID=1329895 RepID=UPI002409C17D|nr:DUF4336 domain-containing protein [Novosphingobium lindaniclasticum]MDF2639951.1 hypothetical protein [Novosphingobium lindaniclasticum]
MHRSRKFALATSATVGGAGLLALYRWWSLRSGYSAPDRVGYPPLGIPKSLAKDLWIVDDTMVASGMSLPIRMTVVRLEGGALMLHSPVACTPELKGALADLGTVRHLLAPTTAHWTHLSDWQQAYPDAKTWAVPGLRDRAQVRMSKVRIDDDLQDLAPSAWQDEVEQGLLRGGNVFCESYLFHKASRTLILCDTIQNLEPVKLPPITRIMARLAGGTHATTAHHVRTALGFGGAETRAAIQRMIGLNPERVLFAHGVSFEEDAARKLRNAFRWTGDIT